ncbi:rCG36451 [Rattus norvegicus]|uniref:RCG36451 n=1 Tax=Rattus norvegicus TaxID=10116 RepID=A6IPY3_RAT|nr:rCG36451 [Rattus norvegicus]
MEYKMHPNVPFQKHQGEVIIWSEGKNHSMEIYFQDPNGCQEIWEGICKVHGKAPSVEITQELTNNLESFEELPPIRSLIERSKCGPCTLQNIPNLLCCIDGMPSQKKRLVLDLENEGYIKKLLQLFHTCEKHRNMEGLLYLNSIIRGILFLNDTRLFKIMFSDEFIMDVIGCQEYGHGLDQPKWYRKVLIQNY